MPPRPDPVAGRAAEEAAAVKLRREGYRVLARNLVTPYGEIDIVAERAGALVIVEVKARRAGGLAGSPEDALTRPKLRRVARAAAHVASQKGMAESPREFLGVAVDLSPEGAPTNVRLYPVEDVA
jgi:putative endonuclease